MPSLLGEAQLLDHHVAAIGAHGIRGPVLRCGHSFPHFPHVNKGLMMDAFSSQGQNAGETVRARRVGRALLIFFYVVSYYYLLFIIIINNNKQTTKK